VSEPSTPPSALFTSFTEPAGVDNAQSVELTDQMRCGNNDYDFELGSVLSDLGGMNEFGDLGDLTTTMVMPQCKRIVVQRERVWRTTNRCGDSVQALQQQFIDLRAEYIDKRSVDWCLGNEVCWGCYLMPIPRVAKVMSRFCRICCRDVPVSASNYTASILKSAIQCFIMCCV